MRDILLEQEFPALNIGPGIALLEKILPEDHIKITLDLEMKVFKHYRGIPNNHLITAVAERMPFRDSSIPTITTQSTFQVMLNQKVFLFELLRVLRPKGIFIITIEYGNTYNVAAQQFRIHPDPEKDETDKLLIYIKSLGLHISVVKCLNLNGTWRDNKAEAFSLWIIGEKEEDNGDRFRNCRC